MNWQRVCINYSIRVICILSIIFSYNPSLFSNSEGDGTISGYIFNVSHQPLAGVEVRAIAYKGTFFQRITYSADDGSYIIDQLPVGQYSLRVQNKLGYLDVFYNNVTNEVDASVIKINIGQHVTNINFYLERGGFISGYIFDAEGNRVTTNTSIGFFDAENFSLRGFINGNPDGSYVSPALPNRPHIVKASSIPLGYVIMYYNNVSNKQNAQALYVTSPDTIKNINFFLQKGGAISGFVRADNPESSPIPDVWVVVTNWENGEWSSECRTDATGYYCAAGLRPGTYRVYTYEVDPLNYHNEYYQDSSQRENASEVIVVNQDTTEQINFVLKTVKRLVISNDYIEVAVSDRYPGTNLSIGITGGLPETLLDDNKPLLFGHPYPYSSYTTIWIDGKELIYGSSSGDLVDDPYITHDGKSIERGWDYQKLSVKQKISLVVSEWSDKKYEDTAQIQYRIINNDNAAHEVGVRILFDLMLGRDDAVPIRTSNFGYTNYERDFYSPNIPDWWGAIEGDVTKIMFSIQGTLKDFGAKTPDRFSTVNWSHCYKAKWEYDTNPELNVINDSGVALWWNPLTIRPGEERIICTFVGLGTMPPDNKPPYTANHIPEKYSSHAPLNTNIQLDILDDDSGVDSSTIAMTVNGDIVTPRISGTFQRYTVTYNPLSEFLYNDTVKVKITASDLALLPNEMEPDQYEFYIVRDTIPPYINDLYPKPNACNVPPDTCLSFLLGDEHSGVDTNSIFITLNDIPIRPQLNKTPDGYSVYYSFQRLFGEMDSISVKIFATDLVIPPNEFDTTFFFFVTRDSIAPWVEYYYPLDKAKEVELNSSIIIKLIDDLSGVDRNSIRLQLDRKLVNPEIKEDASGYLITYHPDTGFQYNQQIEVILNAHDLAKMPNDMAPFVFSFNTVTDTLPPTISFLTPTEDDTNVSQTPLITVELNDENAGVDSTSIKMLINGDAVTYSLTGNKHKYQISYLQHRPFDYLDWITVLVFARDLSNPPNISDTCTCKFRITREKDLSPPYTTLHQPPDGATNVSPDCSISFHIKDDLSGVDSNSIHLKLDGTFVEPTISGDVHDYKILYNPPDPFWYGQQVLLEIDAWDLAKDAPNVMKTDSCLFTIMFDKSPPEIIWIKPGQPGEYIPLDSEFIADITDLLTGVNFNSLKFKFQDQPINAQIDYNQNSCRMYYKPTDRLKYNQRVEFIITGSDLASQPNWIKDSLFTFYTIEDHNPPYITSRTPQANETGVSFNTDIIVYINDDIAGVNVDSIQMTVEGVVVTPLISGTRKSYQLLYKEPNGFRSGQRVDITVDAEDLSNPPNKMFTDNYSFFIKEIYPDLFIKSFTADFSKVLVHKPIQLDAKIGVEIAPVFDPIEIKIWDNERAIFDTILPPMHGNEIVDFSRSIIFNDKGKHELKLTIDSENKIRETDETNNTAIQVIDVIEGELIVRSNPFTPNGDGINDIVIFNFEKLSVAEPSLKLYDISGRMIATLKEREKYKIIWDGSDRFGNQAQPGVYLYLLHDQEKTVANGYVVLAR